MPLLFPLLLPLLLLLLLLSPCGVSAADGCVLWAQLVNLFGSVRDKWIAEDLTGWLAPNRIYPGVADAVRATLSSSDTEVYIVTTKQVGFGGSVQGFVDGVTDAGRSTLSSSDNSIRSLCRWEWGFGRVIAVFCFGKPRTFS